MVEYSDFSFRDNSVAGAYDDVLVPVLFEPWAVGLVEEYGRWENMCVLDLATGTGIVAQLLAERVGPEGKVIGVDINREMLALAKNRCSDVTQAVHFLESPAHSLEIADGTVDVVICQQGFQFFPDRRGAAEEMYRVLHRGGRVVVSTWLPVTECEFFGIICNALSAIEESEISEMMRIPFDFMPGTELALHFGSAGFADVEVKRQEQDLVFSGGLQHAITAAYSTPVSPKLLALPEEKQILFRKKMAGLLNELSNDGLKMGRMVSNVLSARKPT